MTKIPDWQAKYIQNRQAGQVPVAKPVPNAPNFSRPPNGPAPRTENNLDITDILKQRLMQGAVSTQMGGRGGPADLVEGMPYYTRIQSDNFGHTALLFKQAGIINGPTSKGVQIKGELAGYIIDNIRGAVDMAKITDSGDKISLVEISVPFLGTFMVQREAVINRNSGPMGDGRRILKG